MRINCKIIDGIYKGKTGYIADENSVYYFVYLDFMNDLIIFPKTGYVEIIEG